MDGVRERNEGVHCPLCIQSSYTEEAAVSVDCLRNYWRQFNYDIDADFPNLPGVLSQYRCKNCGLHWFAPNLVGSAGLYEKLAEWEPYYRSNAWEWDIAIDILKEQRVESVLEVGAGPGEFLKRALPVISRCEGLEFNAAALAEARADGISVSDRPLHLIEGNQSAIVAFQLLEHVENPRSFLNTCAARLRRGGLLILSVPNQDGFIGELDRNFLNRPPHHATLWRKSCFEAVAECFGLEFVDYRTAPIEYGQFKLYLLRHARPSKRFWGKISNLVRRTAVTLVAPVLYPFQRHTIPGEAHLAVFRKVSD